MLNNTLTMVGPGLDYAAWNGAMLVGPKGGLFGINICSIENGQYLKNLNYYDQIKEVGPYMPDGSYAQFIAPSHVVSWARIDAAALCAKITSAKDGLIIVVEVYPAHDYAMRNEQKPGFVAYENPASFYRQQENIITGQCPIVETISGKTQITGGYAIFTGRSIRSADENKGMDYFCLQSYPVLETKPISEGRIAEKSEPTDGRTAYLKYSLNKGDSVWLQARVADIPLEAVHLLPENELPQILKNAADQYARNRLFGSGVFGGTAEPMMNNLFWTTTYNPFEKKRVLSPGRQWHLDGRYNMWGWDENFTAIMASLTDYEIPKTNITLSHDERIGPYATWYVYARYRDLEMLRHNFEVYRNIYPPYDDAVVSGGPGYYSLVGKGMDDTPMREHWRNMGQMYSLDMSCMKAWSLELLAKMASEIGSIEESRQYQKAYRSLLEKIDETFWNEQYGIYRNRYLSGEWPVTESPTSFYPWLAGQLPDGVSVKLSANLINPNKFWGEFVIPTLAKDDPQYGIKAPYPHEDQYFPPYCYWRGTIWPPSNFIVYEGLKRNQLDEIAAEFAKKSCLLWMKNYQEFGHVCENYDPEKGTRSEVSDIHHAWAMLLPMMGVKEIIDVEIWDDIDAIRFGSFSEMPNELKNYRLLNCVYDVKIGHGHTQLTQNRNVIFDADGGPAVIRRFKANSNGCSFQTHSKNALKIRLQPHLTTKKIEFSVPASKNTIDVSKERVTIRSITNSGD